MAANPNSLFEWCAKLFKCFVRLKFETQVKSLLLMSFIVVGLMTYGYIKLTHHEGKAFYAFYQTSIRGYLFSGFISVGSLLMSLHTFVIANFKEKLFTTDRYKQKFAENHSIQIKNIEDKKLLEPLDKLSSFINISIWLSILTAVSQFTVGLADVGILAVFCIWLAMLTIFFLLNCLILIRENIRNMLHQEE